MTSRDGGPSRDGLPVGDFDSIESSSDPGRFVEWMRHQRAYGADRALSLLELTDSDSVLDIGCGPGADLEKMNQQARSAVGVDLSETMIKAAQGRVPTAKVLIGRATDLPFSDGSFDAVWARALLIHVPDVETAVSEVARVLKPGGRVVLSEPDHGSHIVETAYPATLREDQEASADSIPQSRGRQESARPGHRCRPVGRRHVGYSNRAHISCISTSGWWPVRPGHP